MGARVLIVEDDHAIRLTLERLLERQGYETVTTSDGLEAVRIIERGGIDVVLLDLGLPTIDGIGVLEQLQTAAELPSIIVVTARGDMDSTVRCVQLGAFDYLVKPLDMEQLTCLVRRALRAREATRNLSAPEDTAAVRCIVGQSAPMREVYKTIGAVSTSRASVLIRGESGTGKELVARAVHASSADAAHPFVAVNCTALSSELLESELFGHVRGAFTGAVANKLGRFELAGRGTLFLDEIAEVPLELQAKLLRVLQERSFERVGDARPVELQARIIAATNANLEQLVSSGRFRGDLYYRLKVVEIELPALRDRMDDLPLLIPNLLRKINLDQNKPATQISPDALKRLRQHTWPGNVRELENVLTRAVVLARGSVLDCELLALDPSQAAADRGQEGWSLREVERQHIARTLSKTGWNKRRTCALLQISRPTLDRKIEEFQLERGSV